MLAATALGAFSRGAMYANARSHEAALAGAPAPFAFPKVQTRTLPNGLRVVLIEDHALPLVAVRAVVGVDSLDDPVGKEGLFVLTAGMLREGTVSMTGDQLLAAASSLGNVVFPLRFTTITQNFDRSLELMADMLIHPSFPQPALDRVKATLAANPAATAAGAGDDSEPDFSRPTIRRGSSDRTNGDCVRRDDGADHTPAISNVFTARISARTTRR